MRIYGPEQGRIDKDVGPGPETVFVPYPQKKN